MKKKKKTGNAQKNIENPISWLFKNPPESLRRKAFHAEKLSTLIVIPCYMKNVQQ